MAGQRQPDDQLIEPILGHGEIEKDLIGTGFLFEERIVEGVGGPSALPIDELSADLVLLGQPTDRHRSRQCMQRHILPLLRPHRHRRIENRGLGLWKYTGNAKIGTHVCFLHETG